MNPTVAMFLGFVVAGLILLWAVVELAQRYSRQKKADTQARNAWVLLKPTTTQVVDVVSDDKESESTPDTDLHKRAKQNGHYSPSKPTV